MPDPAPNRPHVTIRDIAAVLGVHHSTVSLALRDNRRISATMRERVREQAKVMGYQPDPMLSALANYRLTQKAQKITSALAWFNGWENPKRLREYLEFDTYLQGVQDRAQELGYNLEEFRLGVEMSPERLHRVLQARNIRGVVLPPHQGNPDWGDFPWQHYCLIRYGRSLSEPRCHLVIPDHVSNTILAYENIHRLGYRRIGFVGFAAELRKRRILFEVGYLAAQECVAAAGKLPPFLFTHYDSARHSKEFEKWLRKHRPDAIYTSVPHLGEMINEAGLKVPDDIGLASTTVLDTPIPAGINQSPLEIGRVSVSTLHSLILQSKFGIPKNHRQILIEGIWEDGWTLPSRIHHIPKS